MNMVLEALEHAYDVVLVYVGAATGAELAADGLVAGCKGAILFAPSARGADAAVLLEHLHRLGARSTRLVKVGGASRKRTDKAASARIAVNA
jgi:predicted ATP-grasp superfamily ATP-dependent carboligase